MSSSIVRPGIEQGFQNAVAGADQAIVVTTPENAAVRDADRIIGLLEQEASSIPEADHQPRPPEDGEKRRNARYRRNLRGAGHRFARHRAG